MPWYVVNGEQQVEGSGRKSTNQPFIRLVAAIIFFLVLFV